MVLKLGGTQKDIATGKFLPALIKLCSQLFHEKIQLNSEPLENAFKEFIGFFFSSCL